MSDGVRTLRWRGMRILALVLAALIVPVMVQAAPAAPRIAPQFDLELFSGTTFRLAEARGSAVVVLFWAPW